MTLSKHTRWTPDKISHGCEPILQLCEQVNYPVDMDFILNVCLLDQVQTQGTAINACYTMFEADRISPLWVESSKNVDLILVPSEWNRDVFIESGVDANKIMIVPLGVNTSVYNLNVPRLGMVSDRDRAISDFKHRFLCVQELVSRKNVPNLLRAWVKAVTQDDNACLILKLGSHSGDKLGNFRERFLQDLSDEEMQLLRDTVFIHTRVLPEHLMPPLYSLCTHYITMSCGEGWGLPETKAGAMGKYLVAPNHSGLASYVSEDTAFVIDWKREDAKQEGPTRQLYEGAGWFRPVQDSAVEQIRASIDAASNEDRSKPDKLHSLITEEFTYGASAERLLDCLENYQGLGYNGRELPYKRNEIFSNFSMYVKTMGTKCGIANYSHKLFSYMIKKHQKEDKRGSGILSGTGDHGLLDLLDRNSIEVAHMQLEYQFITEQRLKHLLRQCRARGIKSVVTMHTLHPKTGGFNHVVAREADAVIVSSELMAETMAGLSDPSHFGHRLAVIPMGCDLRMIRFFSGEPYEGTRPYKLGFFGFAYFHKGIDVLLLAMKSLQTIFGPGKVELDIFSVKPDQDAVGYFERCQKLVEFLGLEQCVNWNAEYLEEEAVVEGLSKTDMIVLPYSEYGGIGVSAAGRTALQAGVPLALTNNSFFHDLTHYRDGAMAMRVDRPQDLAGALVQHMKRMLENPALQQQAVQEFTRMRGLFCQEHSWEKCAEAHLALYDEICS